jgi:hypothetical protein
MLPGRENKTQIYPLRNGAKHTAETAKQTHMNIPSVLCAFAVKNQFEFISDSVI